MNAITLQELLAVTLAEVLGEAIYALVDKDDNLLDGKSSVVECLVPFSGMYTGSVSLVVERVSAAEIACAFLGTDTTDAATDADLGAFGELANIVTGRLLESWMDGNSNYEIGIPKLHETTQLLTRFETEPQVCRVGLRTDGGLRIRAAILLGAWA